MSKSCHSATVHVCHGTNSASQRYHNDASVLGNWGEHVSLLGCSLSVVQCRSNKELNHYDHYDRASIDY